MPAANHSYYLPQLLPGEPAVGGSMVLDNTLLDLSKVKVPVYNLATREDHIAPRIRCLYGSQFSAARSNTLLSGSGISRRRQSAGVGQVPVLDHDTIKDSNSPTGSRTPPSTRDRGGRTGASGFKHRRRDRACAGGRDAAMPRSRMPGSYVRVSA